MTDPKLREARIAEAKRRVTAADLHDAHNNISRHIAEMRMLSDLIETDWRPEPEVDAVTLAAREWMKAYPDFNIWTEAIDGGWHDGNSYFDAFRAGHAHALANTPDCDELTARLESARIRIKSLEDALANHPDTRRMDWLERCDVFATQSGDGMTAVLVDHKVVGSGSLRTKIDRAMEGGE